MFENRPGVDIGKTTLITPRLEMLIALKENSFAWLQGTGHGDSLVRAAADPEWYNETFPPMEERAAEQLSLPTTVEAKTLLQNDVLKVNKADKPAQLKIEGSVGSVGVPQGPNKLRLMSCSQRND